MANRKDVAKLAGVSEATVSRVLNGIGPMKESTRQRVMAAAKQLNYELNAIAANFARGRSGNLGVVLPTLPKVHLFSTHYFSEILGGIGEAVRAKGYGLLLLFRDPEEVFDYVSLFRTQRVDACIVLGASALPTEREAMERLAGENLPICVMDQRFEGLNICSVATNHEQGSYEAVKHLIHNGYRRIGFINGSLQYSNSTDRLAGYSKAIQEAGIPYDASIVYQGNYSRTSGRRVANSVYEDLHKLDALFVANDRMAIGLIQGLREKGVQLPEQLAIVGFDDSDAASMTEPQLTTVKVPFYEMGRQATERLLTRISTSEHENEQPPFHEILDTQLIIRKSCGTVKDQLTQ
ncbi:MAG: LacI family DNA-binding transcriptional regulator [Candidatus Cohnella colombiensis]|uniref:LacI family DNA-binding transcriptional regulator n=1 Tax=Candidatus Cohnella colombiensis TaxID=3121368 RepID=A0AA95EXQ0_9BACL|nr:MAG: LacI family DNA-binding transcriptional regulator [Cohnella sp.]